MPHSSRRSGTLSAKTKRADLQSSMAKHGPANLSGLQLANVLFFFFHSKRRLRTGPRGTIFPFPVPEVPYMISGADEPVI